MQNIVVKLQQEILALAIEISTKKAHTVVINYVGGCNAFNVYIYKGGWTIDYNIKDVINYTLWDFYEEKVKIDLLHKIIIQLQELKHDCKITYLSKAKSFC